MGRTRGERALVLALVFLVAGCAEPANRILAPSRSAAVVTDAASAAPSEERAALTTIAQLVARAMDNEPARQHLKRDMHAAQFREHKLDLGAYLASKDGRALLGRLSELGGGEQAVLATLAKIRRLEFYMPVATQRETWTGKSDVLVVSQLGESEPMVSFDQRGNAVALDRDAPPAQPVLSIVPVETNFSQPMPAGGSRNARDRNGEAIGTLEPLAIKGSSLIACGETCGGGGGGGGTPAIPPGLYLEFSRILDMKEPWVRGDPEIEVHIHGPTSAAAPLYGENLSCSGEHAPDYRKVFDQNTGFWDGRVMLYSEAEVVDFTNKFKDGFHILFWEDDNEPCTLKLDSNTLIELLKSTASATGTVAIKVVPGATWPIIAAAFIGNLFANAGAWLQTNDDFLGVAVDQSSAGYSYPGNTHVLMDGVRLNGRATIVYHH
jgi:hypothetical protein